VPELSAETWASVKVLEPTPETETTEKTSILKLETEDVRIQILTSSNAESMVDQNKATRVLMLMSNALENHIKQYMSRQAKNTE
jgi:hypothetical protein